MMESPPSVFKRGWEMLWKQPAAYFLVAILPHVVAIGLPILVGRLVVRVVGVHPPANANWDPLTLLSPCRVKTHPEPLTLPLYAKKAGRIPRWHNTCLTHMRLP